MIFPFSLQSIANEKPIRQSTKNKCMKTFDAKCKLMMQKTLSVFHLTSTLFMYYMLKSTRSLFFYLQEFFTNHKKQ